MKKKLRILAAGDLHGSKDIAKKISKKALEEQADIILLTGDISGAGSLDETILEPFTQKKQKILFVPGNWDEEEDTKIIEQNARNIHGRYVTYQDINIIGIGSENWKLKLDQSDFYLLKKSFEKSKTQKKILVSHLHAEGTKAEFSGFKGDSIIRKAVTQFKPDVLITSHIHEAEGLHDKIGTTRVLQVGRKGTILEL